MKKRQRIKQFRRNGIMLDNDTKTLEFRRNGIMVETITGIKRKFRRNEIKIQKQWQILTHKSTFMQSFQF